MVPGVIRQADPAAITRAEKRYQVQPDLFRRAGVGRGALQQRKGQAILLHSIYSEIDFGQRTHPGRQKYGQTRGSHTLQHRGVVNFAGSHLPGCDSYTIEELYSLERKRGAEKLQAALRSVALETSPLVFGKLHSLPVVVAGRVLRAELYAPRLSWSRFRRGDMGLELDCVGSGVCCRIYIGMGHAEAAVVCLSHLCDDQARSILVLYGLIAIGVHF